MSFVITLWPSTTPELLRRKENSSLTSCSPPRLPHDSWALRIKEKNKDAGGGMCALSCVRLFATPWTVAHHILLSLGFSRQEYNSGCHFLLQKVNSAPLTPPALAGGFFIIVPPGTPWRRYTRCLLSHVTANPVSSDQSRFSLCLFACLALLGLCCCACFL